MNTEMNANSTPSTTRQPTPRRTATGLRIATVALSLTALCLSYRAANEAMELYGLLEKVQDTLAQEQIIKDQATNPAQIAETKSPAAGL